MDILSNYREIIKRALSNYINIQYARGDIYNESIFDDENSRYLVMSVGWDGIRRIHGCLIHVDIIDNKVWIQRDGTEHGIATEFVSLGIPPAYIVLGFHSPDVRQHTEFAAA